MSGLKLGTEAMPLLIEKARKSHPGNEERQGRFYLFYLVCVHMHGKNMEGKGNFEELILF